MKPDIVDRDGGRRADFCWSAPGSGWPEPARLLSVNNHGRLAAAASERSAPVATAPLLVRLETEDAGGAHVRASRDQLA